MKWLSKKQIYDLGSSDAIDLINKRVKIHSIRKDLKPENIGILRKVELADNYPNKPFCLILETNNGEKITIGILDIVKIEFI